MFNMYPSMNSLDVFNEASGCFPAALVATELKPKHDVGMRI